MLKPAIKVKTIKIISLLYKKINTEVSKIKIKKLLNGRYEIKGICYGEKIEVEDESIKKCFIKVSQVVQIKFFREYKEKVGGGDR